MTQPDPGSANERTALAWQRTALTLIAGTAIMARLAVDQSGPPVLALVVVAAVLGTWVFFESAARYRHSAGHRTRPKGRGGRAALALAIATALIGLGELVLLTQTGPA
ncbi:uncharacterized membrane protein YidH (DUF202 family) [Nocardioides daedukensis]|uniref:Uncharacterized membrane protein YidH (DUF202 family) n=1 Tax=Nocardioides daedukensis TaxID=634462 RepID=A0A7Y9URM2_9ACTN|nr:uncharacterized membrane protein YidH (DUF202 family) [Nocardioides daedukensis]